MFTFWYSFWRNPCNRRNLPPHNVSPKLCPHILCKAFLFWNPYYSLDRPFTCCFNIQVKASDKNIFFNSITETEKQLCFIDTCHYLFYIKQKINVSSLLGLFLIFVTLINLLILGSFSTFLFCAISVLKKVLKNLLNLYNNAV